MAEMTDQEKLTLPMQRHSNCPDTQCRTCLDDISALGDFLHQETKLSRRSIDILGHYRTWLDRNKIPAETEHGWPTVNVFSAANVNAYLSEWKE